MSNEIINQATDFFKSKEQWYSFLELFHSKDAIRSTWYQKLKEKMNEKFAKNDVVEKWGYHSWGTWDYRWYLKEYGHDSVCLWYIHNSLHLWANPNVHNIQKLSDLLQQKKYLPIISSFDRQDEINDANSQYKIVERGNFSFDDPDDGHIDIDKLAWYAQYDTENLINQISKKINNFRKDENVTNLLLEINKETQIS